MLYDRPYMQASSNGSFGAQKSIVTILLLFTIGVFVLQQSTNVFFPSSSGFDNRFFAEWFALVGQNLRELKVWTIVTYAFLHDTQGIFHIAGNMLGLFFLGRVLEPVLGTTRFLGLYIGGAVLGGFVYLIFHFDEPAQRVLVGASASVMALLALFCRLHPERTITLLLFFVLPVSIQPKWLLRIALGASAFMLFAYEMNGNSGVAHSAHLGGLFAGLAYHRFIYSRDSAESIGASFKRPSIETPDWIKRRKRPQKEVDYTVNRASTQEEMQEEVNRILDKINASGFGSLTSREKETLDRAKDLLSR